MVIDFSATWCGPCRFMEPIVNEFAEIYKDVEFVKLDVDELSVNIFIYIYILSLIIIYYLDKYFL